MNPFVNWRLAYGNLYTFVKTRSFFGRTIWERHMENYLVLYDLYLGIIISTFSIPLTRHCRVDTIAFLAVVCFRR